MASTPLEVQQYSAGMRRWATALCIGSLLLVIGERFSAATIRLVSRGFAGDDVRRIACEAVAAVPELLFVAALWWIREALASFARGELFGRSITLMLDRVGVAVALGAALRILIVPGACRLLGFNPGYWIAFDAAGMVLGAIGVALKAVAGAMRHASTIESELNEIF